MQPSSSAATARQAQVSATTDDGLPVTIQVLQPTGQEARLAALVQYAADGSAPRHDAEDRQLLIVSDQPYSSGEAGSPTEGNFDGGFVHALVGEQPPEDSSGTIAHVSWHCSDG